MKHLYVFNDTTHANIQEACRVSGLNPDQVVMFAFSELVKRLRPDDRICKAMHGETPPKQRSASEGRRPD